MQFSEDSNVLAPNSRREMFAPIMSIEDEESPALGWVFTRKNNCVFVSQNGRTFGYSSQFLNLGLIFVNPPIRFHSFF